MRKTPIIENTPAPRSLYPRPRTRGRGQGEGPTAARLSRQIPTILLLLLLTPPLLAAGPESINLRHTTTVEVVAKTKNAVVNISTTKIINRRVSPFGNDPFWQQFDVGQVMRVPASSLGSGFIIHKDGYVVTNNHVIDRARQIIVELADGRKLPAELLSSDSDADIAILRVRDDKPLPTLDLGDSSDLLIGEPVIAVGNPLGYSHSVSTGIVSAIHRDLKDQQDKILLGDLVQTDAAINPGNSGGPLLNAYGQVIGINTAIRGDAQNIGFAIPVNRLRDLIPELMNPAHVSKIDIPFSLRELRTLSAPATITTQLEYRGDKSRPQFVTEINGQKPGDIVDAYAILLRLNPQQDITLRLNTGDSLKFQTKPVPLPDAIVQARNRLGITIEPLTPMLAEKYHLGTEDGLLITALAKNSIAARAGLQPGDVIIQLGRYRIATLNDLAALLPRLPDKGQVKIGVIRGQQVGFGILTF